MAAHWTHREAQHAFSLQQPQCSSVDAAQLFVLLFYRWSFLKSRSTKKADSAAKRARQSEKRRVYHKAKKSEVRTRMKKFKRIRTTKGPSQSVLLSSFQCSSAIHCDS